ncbi:MAG: AAA family ATPase [Bacteroidales bacterium]|nr:AAA family ATPase [Bacteroidales bacterium]
MIQFDDMPVRYPVGEHSFRELRIGGYLYVDKTIFVARLLRQGKFIFLSRPRRFGKSLLLSTIECYFRGEKALFEGTWLGERETEWEAKPVLHFDMSRSNGLRADLLEAYLHRRLEAFEKEYRVDEHPEITDVGDRFSTLIESVHKKTGSKVVILIDEYDKGILETLDFSEQEREAMSNVLRAFYSQPKATTESIEFCMVTGVARFGSYTLFSGPNNFLDISMNPMYADICGITQEELQKNFKNGIQDLADDRNSSYQDTVEELRIKYDSYRFTRGETLVYNPYSLICAFSEKCLDNFWIKSGISKVFVKYLSQTEFDILELEKLWVTRERMEAKYSKEDSIPLLFQTGYLTIKEVRNGELYRLGIPNGEVRRALVDQLRPRYMSM